MEWFIPTCAYDGLLIIAQVINYKIFAAAFRVYYASV